MSSVPCPVCGGHSTFTYCPERAKLRAAAKLLSPRKRKPSEVASPKSAGLSPATKVLRHQGPDYKSVHLEVNPSANAP